MGELSELWKLLRSKGFVNIIFTQKIQNIEKPKNELCWKW